MIVVVVCVLLLRPKSSCCCGMTNVTVGTAALNSHPRFSSSRLETLVFRTGIFMIDETLIFFFSQGKSIVSFATKQIEYYLSNGTIYIILRQQEPFRMNRYGYPHTDRRTLPLLVISFPSNSSICLSYLINK